MKSYLERQSSLILIIFGLIISWIYFLKIHLAPAFAYVLIYLFFTLAFYLLARKILQSWSFLALALLILNPSFIKLVGQLDFQSQSLVFSAALLLLAFWSFLNFLTSPSRRNLLLAIILFALASFFETQTLFLAGSFLVLMVLFCLVSVAADWQRTLPQDRAKRFGLRAFHYFRALGIILLAGAVAVWFGFSLFRIIFNANFSLWAGFYDYQTWLNQAWPSEKLTWSGFYGFSGPVSFIFFLVIAVGALFNIKKLRGFSLVNYLKGNLWEFSIFGFCLAYFIYGLIFNFSLLIFMTFFALAIVAFYKKLFEIQKPIQEVLNFNFASFLKSFFLKFLLLALAILAVLFLLVSDLIIIF